MGERDGHFEIRPRVRKFKKKKVQSQSHITILKLENLAIKPPSRK